jgi:hypothetical protein
MLHSWWSGRRMNDEAKSSYSKNNLFFEEKEAHAAKK